MPPNWSSSRTGSEHDVWNRIDLALIVVMAGVLGCRLLAIVSSGADGSAPPLYSVGFQALSALLAWLRLLQTLFVFPESGPLLLMTLQMFRDLKTFLMLALVIVLAFGCAFLVLFTAEDPQFRLTLGDVVEKLIEAALGGVSVAVVQQSDFAHYGDREGGRERPDNVHKKLGLAQKKRAIASFPGDVLRATQVQVHGIHMGLHHATRQ